MNCSQGVVVTKCLRFTSRWKRCVFPHNLFVANFISLILLTIYNSSWKIPPPAKREKIPNLGCRHLSRWSWVVYFVGHNSFQPQQIVNNLFLFSLLGNKWFAVKKKNHCIVLFFFLSGIINFEVIFVKGLEYHLYNIGWSQYIILWTNIFSLIKLESPTLLLHYHIFKTAKDLDTKIRF